MERYAAKSAAQITAVADWWATGWQTLPERRIDLTGEVEEPLTFQWAGSLQDLENILQQDGWGPSIGWTPATALKWLTATTDAAAVPVVPLFSSGRLPYLTFVRSANTTTAASSRLVLRLWATDLGVTNGQTVPLWMGSVMEERIYRPLSLITLVSTQPDFNAPRQALAQSLEGGSLVSRTVKQANAEWDGRVLLAHQK
ncbi:LssY C-terminal domain-containing protein [Rhizobium beringeri]